MKIGYLRFLALSLLVLFSKAAVSTEVPSAVLRQVAQRFFTEQYTRHHGGKALLSTISESHAVIRESMRVYDIFNFTQGGWIVLSADDRAVPVLAYSLNGRMEPGSGSPDMQWWLDQYAQEVLYCIREKQNAEPDQQAQWNALLNGTDRLAAGGTRSMEPLLESTWNQGAFYNYYCPLDASGPGGRVYAGCVATSMTQVMYYYRHPLQGTGSHGYYSDYGFLEVDFSAQQYDWNAMQNDISGHYNLPVALLQYHCGVAVDMGYSPDGSGAYMGDARDALVQYFGYSATANLKQKNSYSNTAWENMIIAELDARRPLSYAGYGDDGGHAFVCDGYDGSGMFHFNWGWSGYGDGYYTLTTMNPSGSFADGQQAIFQLYPAAPYIQGCSASNTLTAECGTLQDGSGPLANYAANGDCTWLIDPADTVQSIRLEFTRFSTESANDIVTVYDGGDINAPVLGIFSGSSLPPALFSTGGKMLIRFTTNGTVEEAGWSASYTSQLVRYCESLTELNQASGSFNDGSGQNDYHNNSACRWRIAPSGATGITLNFQAIDLVGNDFVSVIDEASGTQLGPFSGNTLPSWLFIGSGRALVIFISDGVGTADGFDLSWTSSASGLEESGSPAFLSAYPNPAHDKITVVMPAARPVNLRLLSASGAEVLHLPLIPANGEIRTVLDVSGFAAGLYLLSVEQEGHRKLQRIVISTALSR